MKIQFKINLVSLGILIAVVIAISAAGALTIQRLSYDLNHKLLSTELAKVMEDLKDVQQVLVQSGVAKAPGYVKSAQQTFLDDLTRSNENRFGHLAIIDTSGELLLHENLPAGLVLDVDCLPQILKNKHFVTQCTYDDAQWIFFSQHFSQWGWIVILSASDQEMTSMRNAFLRQVMLIVACSILAGCIILIALTRSIVSPIQQLATVAMNLSKGRFNQPLPKISTNDEVADLTRAFKIMSFNLAAAHQDLERQTQELTKTNKDLEQQIVEREKAEQDLADLNHRLEQLVEERTGELAAKADELEKANQRLLELDEMKSAFLSSVSHELRTPLTSVRGFAKMICKDFVKHFKPLIQNQSTLEKKSERILSNLNIIESEGARLTRMINDVLDLNKIESGRIEWDDTDVDPAVCLLQAASMLQYVFSRKTAVQFNVDVPETLPHIRIDPDRFEQVFINLLNNAAKFTSQGNVTLKAEVIGKTLRIEVSDTGEGIPQSDLATIFDKFHQVRKRDTLNRGSQGTGLGLAICKQIVTHYKGDISVISEVGKGSTFTVEIPLHPNQV